MASKIFHVQCLCQSNEDTVKAMLLGKKHQSEVLQAKYVRGIGLYFYKSYVTGKLELLKSA